ncbi:hypothetical protein E4U42_002393 [Claviceps africana]|uniref:SWI5-dependent HO expression protein 3 n=1 Tax=Claviceps africana TaxID=83212 RepID=A0A8K0JE89_9HYPO|nr:hypothetical protein E4U42_002393 [Claviceps africana]
MDTMMASRLSPSHDVAKHALARTATIRSVPSFEGCESSPESRRSVFTGSVDSTTSGSSAMGEHHTGDEQEQQEQHQREQRDQEPEEQREPQEQQQQEQQQEEQEEQQEQEQEQEQEQKQQQQQQQQEQQQQEEKEEQQQQSEQRPSTRLKQDSPLSEANTPSRWSSNGVRAVEHSPPQDSSAAPEDAESGHWDSTVGKAGLGKTGRVINRLVSDNDALKRDIQIERLRAEEAKQAAKLIEDKMDRMMNEYESRLLEANVTKALLARKERQVESLTSAIELEKRKAQAAQQSERCWKEELDAIKTKSTIRVEEATSYALLMEGRYNAISSHWRDRGEEFKRTVSKLRGDISTVVDERKSDDHKITTLRDLCEQQDNNIKELLREKEKIARLFEEYKKTQEDELRDIKTSAKQRQEEQEKQLHEARETLHKLKWALNVKQNVKDAE